MTGSPWTAERDAKLTALWTAGTTTNAIGAAMSITKNAAIGRARRLDLPPRPSPIKRPGTASPAAGSVPKPQPVRPRAVAPARVPVPAPPPVEAPVVFRDPPQTTCQYPLNDGQPWQFCQENALPGQSWCPVHRIRVFTRRQLETWHA
jgi:GcrA cell cycle regulator